MLRMFVILGLFTASALVSGPAVSQDEPRNVTGRYRFISESVLNTLDGRERKIRRGDFRLNRRGVQGRTNFRQNQAEFYALRIPDGVRIDQDRRIQRVRLVGRVYLINPAPTSWGRANGRLMVRRRNDGSVTLEMTVRSRIRFGPLFGSAFRTMIEGIRQ